MIAVLLCVATLLPQDPAPARPQAQPAAAPKAPAKPVEAWDDKAAKAALDQFHKAWKPAGSLAERTAALELLATGANQNLVKPLAKIAESDKALLVQKRAIELLGNQPAAAANPALCKLLKVARVRSQPPVLAELVRSLARCGYAAAQWDLVEDLFDESYDPDRVPLHTAVFELAIQHKEPQALGLLLRNLDEPVPHDVDHADNPPAEYWKARWGSWSAWREKVKDALFAITSQRFGTAAEAKAWLEKNPIAGFDLAKYEERRDGKGKKKK